MEVCRLCLCEDQLLVSVVDGTVQEPTEDDYTHRINLCTSVEIKNSDGLPCTVCVTCIGKINSWWDFREACVESQKALLNTSFKSEQSDRSLRSGGGTKRERSNSDAHSEVSVNGDDDDDDNCDSRGDLATPEPDYTETKVTKDAKLSSKGDIKKESDVKSNGMNPDVVVNEKEKKSTWDMPDFAYSDGEPEDHFMLMGEEYDLFDGTVKLELSSSLYTCGICEKQFDDLFEYLDHQPGHNGQPVFNCNLCPTTFSSREELLEHDVTHKIPCPKCSKPVQRTSMKAHLVKHTDRHVCDRCSMHFTSKSVLAQHVLTIHTNIRDHICETCGKSFPTKTAINTHRQSHSEERPYGCKHCSYAGRTSSALYVHMSAHAKDTCICEMCSKAFKSTRNLSDHLRRVHSKDKKHICAYCDKKFVDKYMLTVHVRSHTGVRPYSCTLCEKAFIRSDGLKEHMLTHGERLQFECPVCLRKFATKKGVTRHHCTGAL